MKDRWNQAYYEQVRLLVEVLPLVMVEEDFALKGETAINLFYRDLPRLSVDIDLTYLPLVERDAALTAIEEAMHRLAASATRGVAGAPMAGGGGQATRALLRRGKAAIKVEVSPVGRGTVFEPQTLRVRPAVEDTFGFAEARVVAFEDLFAGKMVAALDRQHPRDLFDVKLLLENEGITDELFNTFLVYIACSNRPPHELLDPNHRDVSVTFKREFEGMTAQSLTIDLLEATRVQLVEEIRERLSGTAADFLRSLVLGEPDFEAIHLPQGAGLPAVLWKVENLKRLAAADRERFRKQAERLEALLS